MDLYAYAMFTGPTADRIRGEVAKLADRLQHVDVNLSLRTVPLEIQR